MTYNENKTEKPVKFYIVPQTDHAMVIEEPGLDAETAMSQFALLMDSDMNAYFKELIFSGLHSFAEKYRRGEFPSAMELPVESSVPGGKAAVSPVE